MASTDAGVAVQGAIALLLADASVRAALGTRIFRDTIPQSVSLPAVAVASSGFQVGTRPQRQGGTSIQIWSRGTVSLFIKTVRDYDDNLARLCMNALDNKAEVAVGSVGTLHWLRYFDEGDEEIRQGDTSVFKLKTINFLAAAKAT